MTIGKQLDQLSGFLPGGALDIVREQLTRVASKGSKMLGTTFPDRVGNISLERQCR